MSWSPATYLKFEDERTRPVRDLLAAVPGRDVRRAADLGCGPGNSTEVLIAQFPAAVVVGLDSSTEMIATARQRLPEVRFELGGIETWADPGPFDLILANAVLQWLPDHSRLLPRLVDRLAPGGSLAVQMPDNLDEPAHRLMREVAARGPWARKLEQTARGSLLGADGYYATLRPVCARVDIWRTVYHHPLAGGAASVVAWFEGSGLRPFLAPLDEKERLAFLELYTTEIGKAYPAAADGSVLLPFPRLFFVATR